jgi:hypothetical protein
LLHIAQHQYAALVDVRVGYATVDDDAQDVFGSWAESSWLASIGYSF